MNKNTHWSSLPIHIIDFEGTTNSGIIEYGVVTLHQRNIVKTEGRLCQSTGSINALDTRQHGITPKMVENTLPFTNEWDLFSKLRETGLLGAHHAQTENHLLKTTWPYPRTGPNFINLNQPQTSWGPWLDTCQLFKIIFPQLKNHKLSELINIFNLKQNLENLSSLYCPSDRRKYHCALYDALASAILLLYLCNLPEFKNCTLEWLILHSNSQEQKDNMQQMLL